MKKSLLCVLLAACLLLLTSCSAVKEIIPFIEKEPLYEISELKSTERYYLNTAIHDNLLAIYGTDTSEEQKPFIVLYDIDKHNVLTDSSIERSFDYITAFGFSEDVLSGDEATLQIIDGSENTAYYYDMYTLEEVSSEENQNAEYKAKAADAGVDEDEFSLYENHAKCYMTNWQAYLFYNEPDNIYLIDNEASDYFDIDCTSDDKLLLTQSFNSNNSLTFRILDFNNQCLTDSVTTNPYNMYFNVTPTGYSLSAKTNTAAFIVTSGTDTSYFSTPYIWSFSADATENSFTCETFNYNEVEQENETLAAKVSEEYDVNIILDNTELFEEYNIDPESEEYDENESYLVERPNNFKLYCDLKDLEIYLGDFPEGIFTEICTNSGEDGIDIYFVKCMHDDIGTAAFQSEWNNRLKIVFSTDNWCRENVYHEFMHAMEYGIDYEESGKDFDELWLELNPEDFEYHYGNDEDVELESKYFISMYAQTNTLEDRAVTFESMFSSGENESQPYWIEDNDEGIIKKAQLLAKALRQSYKSVANAESVPWEAYIQ